MARGPIVASIATFVACSACALGAEAKPPAEWGGIGYAQIGGFVGSFGNLENDLSRPNALGPDFTIDSLGLQLGGGGKMLVNGAVLLGGKGMAWLPSASDAIGGSGKMVGGGGGLDIGIVAFNRDYWMLYPYLGVGGYGLSVEVTNELAAQPLMIGDNALHQGDTREYNSGFFVFDFGVGLQRFLFWGNGGFAVGVEGGFLTTFVDGDWEDGDGNEVGGLTDLSVSGGYLRLTLGGGGFFYKGDDFLGN